MNMTRRYFREVHNPAGYAAYSDKGVFQHCDRHHKWYKPDGIQIYECTATSRWQYLHGDGKAKAT